jgi:starch-binding outer membrane protein, SusD/RagB family
VVRFLYYDQLLQHGIGNAPDVVDKDKNFTQVDLLRTQAEVKTIRALCYFYLVRAFKEVPWVDDASISDTQDYDKPKQSEDVIIGHILEDLLFARQYAATDYGRTDYNKGRVTQNLVNSLLADVYLWKQDYQSAVDASNLVLADKNLSLVTGENTLSRVFYIGNSDESIFELQFSDNDITNTAVAGMYGSSSDPLGLVAFPTSLHDSPYDSENRTGLYSPFNYKVSSGVVESESDIRAKDSYLEFGGTFYVFKYAGVSRVENSSQTGSTYTYRSNTANWIVYRLSDVMLMKAEALVQLGDSSVQVASDSHFTEALALVNTTYKRSNEDAADLSIANYTSKSALANLVLRERQRELLFEGKRWFDLLRVARREGSTGTVNTYMDHKASGTTASLGVSVLNALYMPIYYYELISNPNLVQNPYYKTTSSSSR